MNFINTDDQKLYNKSGYLVLKNFIKKEILTALKQIYHQHYHNRSNGSMYTNYDDFSPEENEKTKEKIIQLCRESIESQLDNFKIIGTSFIIKGIGKDSDSRLHQDFSIVDESKYNSQIIWIPLVDVNENNGCIQVIPGSHLWFETIRSQNIKSLFLKFDYKINKFLTPITLTQGDAITFSPRLFHGSKQNLTNQERPAIAITLIDAEARYIFYNALPDGKIEVIDCENDEKHRSAYNFFKDGADSSETKKIQILDSYENITEYDFLKKLYTTSSKWNLFNHMILLLYNLSHKFYK